MSVIKHPEHLQHKKTVAESWMLYQDRYGKQTLIAVVVLLVIVGSYAGYKHFVQEPKEKQGEEAMFRAEDYFRMDSVKLALNGDNVNAGFAKIISKYPDTKAAQLATFYAGSCYLKLGEYDKAVKYLKDFSTPALQVQAKAYGLLGDAYSELNKKEDAIAAYKKAGSTFDKDAITSSEYLFRAGYLYESMGRTKEAIDMYQIVKDKYPATQRGFDIDRYLARLGVVK
ncbi:MAG: tetratricopeptide repeat protein [Bacteroidota bacterium]|nr:tetratricopeptide repeat protein [Bacteroidota bacterium]MDP4212647.1 tetratricopeptide repeat protein [Bacteroidota bacterium]MDP4252012.1 tetratricopeptide repeat protein [Bacteroidota bacterium]